MSDDLKKLDTNAIVNKLTDDKKISSESQFDQKSSTNKPQSPTPTDIRKLLGTNRNKHSQIQPKLEDQKMRIIPPNVDFGVEKIANKVALEATSPKHKNYRNDHENTDYENGDSDEPDEDEPDEDEPDEDDDDSDDQQDNNNFLPLNERKTHRSYTPPPPANSQPTTPNDNDNGASGNGASSNGASGMTRHQLHVAKREELTKIERFDKKGYKACKKFTMGDNYDDIVSERKRLEDERGCADAIKWQRKILMGSSSGIEYLNKIYNPFDIQLDGWSESLYENIDDYDEVFEELYHKYKTNVAVPPEIKLVGMFASSAFMFHFSKSLFNNATNTVPGFDDIMKDNPELKKAYEQAGLQKMTNKNNTNNPMSSMIGNFFGNPMLGNMLGGLMSPPPQPQGQSQVQQQPYQQPYQQPQQGQQQGQFRPQQYVKPQSLNNAQINVANNIEMEGPAGVDDMLIALTKGTNMKNIKETQLSDADTEGILSEVASNIKPTTQQKMTIPPTSNKRRLNLTSR